MGLFYSKRGKLGSNVARRPGFLAISPAHPDKN
jgi:hypothetical protein